jgi:hypothetical protein
VKVLNQDNPNQGFDIAARIGIATGQVVVGELMGQETAKERSVFGETPNLAARLQALAKPNQLIIDPSTKRLAGNEFEFADQGTFSLKGFQTPVQAWRVLSIRLSASRFEAHRSSQLANFVGREYEVSLEWHFLKRISSLFLKGFSRKGVFHKKSFKVNLLSLFDPPPGSAIQVSLLYGRWCEAVGGEGQVLFLRGEAGIGKSRITQILCERIAEERHQTIQYQCSPYHTNTALYSSLDYATATLAKPNRMVLVDRSLPNFKETHVR